MTLLANLYSPGSGITSLGGKLPDAIMKRIEWLGKMNDRFNACIENGDRAGLMELAAEYAQHPHMTGTAHRIALLASEAK